MDHDGLDAIAPTGVTRAPLLVNRNRIKPDAAAKSAIIFVNGSAHDTLFANRPPEVAVHNALLCPFIDVGSHFGIKSLRVLSANILCSSEAQVGVFLIRDMFFLRSNCLNLQKTNKCYFFSNDPDR